MKRSAVGLTVEPRLWLIYPGELVLCTVRVLLANHSIVQEKLKFLAPSTFRQLGTWSDISSAAAKNAYYAATSC